MSFRLPLGLICQRYRPKDPVQGLKNWDENYILIELFRPELELFFLGHDFWSKSQICEKDFGFWVCFFLWGGHTFEVDTFSPHREIVTQTHNIYIYTHINVYIYIRTCIYIYKKTQEALSLFGTPKGTVWHPKSLTVHQLAPWKKSRSSCPPKKES